MSYEAWPSPNARRGPLPRIDDLPLAEQGYDQEAVRRAFDDFYRHAAQLDASLKTLEAVEAFQRDAAQLRSDLRSLQSLGLGGSGGGAGWSEAAWLAERPRPELPVTALRLAGEAALLIAIAVVAGVAHLRAVVIVVLMAAALVVVWISEWLAARARTRVAAAIYEPLGYAAIGHARVEPAAAELAGDPAPFVEAPALDSAVGWSAFEAPADEVEALTMTEEPLEDTEEDAGPDDDEDDEPDDADDARDDDEDEDESEDPEDRHQPAARRGWLRRRRPEQEAAPGPPADQSEAAPPSHVRVLTPAGVQTRPWERGFDAPEPEPPES